VFVNFNTTSSETKPEEGGGCAVRILDGTFRVVFASVVSCIGWSMILNAAAGNPSVERFNFISCVVENGGVISANENG
jgi:hypothetical protein